MADHCDQKVGRRAAIDGDSFLTVTSPVSGVLLKATWWADAGKVRHSRHLATANGRIKQTGESFCYSNATPFIVTTYRPESLAAWGRVSRANCKYLLYLCAHVCECNVPQWEQRRARARVPLVPEWGCPETCRGIRWSVRDGQIDQSDDRSIKLQVK